MCSVLCSTRINGPSTTIYNTDFALNMGQRFVVNAAMLILLFIYLPVFCVFRLNYFTCSTHVILVAHSAPFTAFCEPFIHPMFTRLHNALLTCKWVKCEAPNKFMAPRVKSVSQMNISLYFMCALSWLTYRKDLYFN